MLTRWGNMIRFIVYLPLIGVIALTWSMAHPHPPRQEVALALTAPDPEPAPDQEATTTEPTTTTTVAPTTTTTTAPRAHSSAQSDTKTTYPMGKVALLTPTTQASGIPAGCLGHEMGEAEAHHCWDGLVARFPWPRATFFRIMMCESRGKSNAVDYASGTHHGLWQVDHGSFDPETNARQAFSMWQSRGTQPWVCR